jgi:hypothetical protein
MIAASMVAMTLAASSSLGGSDLVKLLIAFLLVALGMARPPLVPDRAWRFICWATAASLALWLIPLPTARHVSVSVCAVAFIFLAFAMEVAHERVAIAGHPKISRTIEFGTAHRGLVRAYVVRLPDGGALHGQPFSPIVLPVTARGANIENCRATVEFEAESFKKAIRGRWENRAQPMKGLGEDWSVFDAITLLKDEDDAIAIAVQHEGDGSAYMLCNRSWEMPLVRGQPDFRMPEFLLPLSVVNVRVTVRGDEMDDQPYEFPIGPVDGVWIPHPENSGGNTPIGHSPDDGRDRENEVQKIRLIRGEIDDGREIVERAIGAANVYVLIEDSNWVGHRLTLAKIPEAGDAYNLSRKAWGGFYRYNRHVSARDFKPDEEHAAVVADAQRASDALRVLEDKVRPK